MDRYGCIIINLLLLRILNYSSSADCINIISIFFSKEGDFVLIISGYNSVQGWIESPPIPITLVNKIANFQLQDDLRVVKPVSDREIKLQNLYYNKYGKLRLYMN